MIPTVEPSLGGHAFGAAFAAMGAHAAAASVVSIPLDQLVRGRLDRWIAEARGPQLVLVTDPGHELSVPDGRDPLLRSSAVTASSADGRRLRAPDLVEVPCTVAGRVLAPLATVDGRVVAATDPGSDVLGDHRLTVLGTARLLEDRWLATGDNASIVWQALSGAVAGPGIDAAHGARPAGPAPDVSVPVVAGRWDPAVYTPPSGVRPDEPAFVRSAGHAARLLDPAVHDRLVDFADDPGPAGALLLRGVPVGRLPSTPSRPTDPVAKDHVSERVLLTVARRLGQPVGYAPELGGSLVQDLVPTAEDLDRQTSTSSRVELAFHTETAFHPHRPRYLLLLCLRGDPAAATTLCSVHDIVHRLPARTRQLLREPRYRTRVDASFRPGDRVRAGRPGPVLGGSEDRPSLCWDADLMEATSPEAGAALDELAGVVAGHHRSIVLEPGDLLVVDNTRCVHGRSPFAARFDGTDRWLQRTFVVADLAPSDDERDGRVVTTRFDV